MTISLGRRLHPASDAPARHWMVWRAGALRLRSCGCTRRTTLLGRSDSTTIRVERDGQHVSDPMQAVFYVLLLIHQQFCVNTDLAISSRHVSRVMFETEITARASPELAEDEDARSKRH